MAAGPSKAERQDRLATLIFARGSVRVDELQESAGVSPMTLYRDLADLEAKHVVQRSRGEVSAAASSLSETPFAFRLGQETEAKEAIARAAQDLVGRGDSVLVDDSTTAYGVLGTLLRRGSLTVVTNCAGAASLVTEHPGTELIMTGGRYVHALQAFYGPSAVASLAGIRADVAVLGAAAIQGGVVHHPYEDVADYKRAAAARARTSVLAVTASKFARTALYEVGPLTDFDLVITDLPPGDPQLAGAREAGVEIRSV